MQKLPEELDPGAEKDFVLNYADFLANEPAGFIGTPTVTLEAQAILDGIVLGVGPDAPVVVSADTTDTPPVTNPNGGLKIKLSTTDPDGDLFNGAGNTYQIEVSAPLDNDTTDNRSFIVRVAQR